MVRAGSGSSTHVSRVFSPLEEFQPPGCVRWVGVAYKMRRRLPPPPSSHASTQSGGGGGGRRGGGDRGRSIWETLLQTVVDEPDGGRRPGAVGRHPAAPGLGGGVGHLVGGNHPHEARRACQRRQQPLLQTARQVYQVGNNQTAINNLKIWLS